METQTGTQPEIRQAQTQGVLLRMKPNLVPEDLT